MINLAQIAYEAYAANTNGKTFDGRDMPMWADLPQRTLDAWKAAVDAVEVALGSSPGSDPQSDALRLALAIEHG